MESGTILGPIDQSALLLVELLLELLRALLAEPPNELLASELLLNWLSCWLSYMIHLGVSYAALLKSTTTYRREVRKYVTLLFSPYG